MNDREQNQSTTPTHKQPKGHHFAIRQILNIIFMVLALIGVGIYIWGNSTTGIIIVLIAMVVKMAECVLRMIR